MTATKKKRLLIPLNNPRRPSPLVRIIQFTIVAVWGPVLFVLGKVYKLCFRWLDQAISKKDDEEFAQEIKYHVLFLFTERNANILSNKNKKLLRAFDASYVFVAADTLIFRFCRCRGEFHVSVASEREPERFELLELLLEAVLCPPESREEIRENCSYLRTLSRVLEPHFDDLKTALSQENHSITLEKAVSTHNRRIEQHGAELRARGPNPRIF